MLAYCVRRLFSALDTSVCQDTYLRFDRGCKPYIHASSERSKARIIILEAADS